MERAQEGMARAEEARKKVAEVNADPEKTAADRRLAQLDYEQAIRDQRDTLEAAAQAHIDILPVTLPKGVSVINNETNEEDITMAKSTKKTKSSRARGVRQASSAAPVQVASTAPKSTGWNE